MTEGGEHGGRSHFETQAAFVLASPSKPLISTNNNNYNNNKDQPIENIRQIDLVPTLSLLMGFELYKIKKCDYFIFRISNPLFQCWKSHSRIGGKCVFEQVAQCLSNDQILPCLL